jgi:DNA-directed RNA polymerase subunit K/omega
MEVVERDVMTETNRSANRPRNAFEFVTVASLRARQLLEGCVPKVEGSPKPARRALQEVTVGAIRPIEPPPPSHR